MFYLLSAISGVILTAQVAINGRLLFFLESPILTSLVSFLVGTISLLITYLAAAYYGLQPIPAMKAVLQTNAWMWTGGLLGAFYVFMTIFCSPKIGFANMSSLIVAGQIITAVLFDHFGFFGSQVHMMTPTRLFGTVLLVISVYLIQTN